MTFKGLLQPKPFCDEMGRTSSCKVKINGLSWRVQHVSYKQHPLHSE